MMIPASLPYPRFNAPPAAAPAPVPPGQVCTPAIKDQIDELVAQAEMSVDTGTFAYGMGGCVSLLAGGLLWQAVHPIAGAVAGVALMAGAVVLARASDREAKEAMARAKDLNDQYHCY